jgi:hypothetical protein
MDICIILHHIIDHQGHENRKRDVMTRGSASRGRRYGGACIRDNLVERSRAVGANVGRCGFITVEFGCDFIKALGACLESIQVRTTYA